MRKIDLSTLLYPLHARELGSAPSVAISHAGKGRDRKFKISSLPDLTEQTRLLSQARSPRKTKETKFAHLDVLKVLNKLSQEVLKSKAVCNYIEAWLNGSYDAALELEAQSYNNSFGRDSNSLAYSVSASDTIFASAIRPKKLKFLGDDFVISPYAFELIFTKELDKNQKPYISFDYNVSFLLAGQNIESMNLIFTPRINQRGELLINQATLVRKSQHPDIANEFYTIGSTFADLPIYENSSLINALIEQAAV